MRKIKLFIMATSMIAFVACSTIYTETLDEESSLDTQTRSETSQKDSTEGGVSATIKDWEVVTDNIEVTETPNYENESDSIPNDSIPNDSIPSDSIPNDSTKNEEFGVMTIL